MTYNVKHLIAAKSLKKIFRLLHHIVLPRFLFIPDNELSLKIYVCAGGRVSHEEDKSCNYVTHI